MPRACIFIVPLVLVGACADHSPRYELDGLTVRTEDFDEVCADSFAYFERRLAVLTHPQDLLGACTSQLSTRSLMQGSFGMAIRQPELLSKSLGGVMAGNSDFKRKPRAGYSWADPLGDGWISKAAKPNFDLGFGLKDDETGPERVGRSAEDTLHAIEARHRRELFLYGGAALSATGALGWLLFRRRGNG